MSKHYYTKQQDDFILNADNVCLKETINEFNELFNVKATKSMLYNRLKTLLGKNIKSDRYRTPEQKKWILDNYKKYKEISFNWKKLTKDFNETFNKNISVTKMKAFIYNDNINVGKSSKKPVTIKAVGETIKAGDRQYIKINDDIQRGKNNYQLKQRYLYEQYHNCKLKENEYIIFLDGNKENYDKDNLVKLTKKELCYFNMLKLENKELRKCAVLYSQIQAKLKVSD